MRSVIVPLILGSFFGASGCVVSDPAGGVTSSAGYVGDRTSTSFSPVIVSVPADGDDYRNLYVTLAAVVNAKAIPSGGGSSGSAFGSSVYDAEDIARRMQPHIAGRVVEIAQAAATGPVKVADLAKLRQQMVAEAQQIINDRLRQWKYHEFYDVQIVITSMYLSDPRERRQ